MKTWIWFTITILLLQAAALAAASGFFEGDFKGVGNDDDGIETLFLLLS